MSRMTGTLLAMAAAGCLCGTASAQQAGPLELSYDVTIIGGGQYYYDFWLTLENLDNSWSSGQGWGWLVFGDEPDQNIGSPLTNWVGDTNTLPAGPWTFFTSSGGGHNGPTLGNVLDTWVPTAIGETIHWGGTSNAFVGQGDMLWSTLVHENGAVMHNFKVATLIPAPGAVALMGLAGLVGTGRRRRH